MPHIQIKTTQNVFISFPLASVAERMVARAIDSLIQGAWVAFIVYVWWNYLRKYVLHLDNWETIALVSFLISPALLYSLFTHAFMNGQSFGKKIMQIRVVKINGYEATFYDFLVRWLFEMVEIQFLGGIIALVTMVVSRHNQRLGGLVTATAVVSEKKKYHLWHTILMKEEPLQVNYFTKNQLLAFSDTDVQNIKNVYTIAKKTKNQMLFEKLAQRIATIAQDAAIYPQAQAYIETFLSDYNALE